MPQKQLLNVVIKGGQEAAECTARLAPVPLPSNSSPLPDEAGKPVGSDCNTDKKHMPTVLVMHSCHVQRL
jgi:hypothetical protein